MVYLLCSFPARQRLPLPEPGAGKGGLRPRGAPGDSPLTKRLSPKYLCLYHLNVIFPLSPLSDRSELFKCKSISPRPPHLPRPPHSPLRHQHRGPFPQADLRTRLSPGPAERSGLRARSGAGGGGGGGPCAFIFKRLGQLGRGGRRRPMGGGEALAALCIRRYSGGSGRRLHGAE